MDEIRKDIQKLKVPNWKTLTQDRRGWKEKLVEKAKTLQRVVQPCKKKKKKVYIFQSVQEQNYAKRNSVQ